MATDIAIFKSCCELCNNNKLFITEPLMYYNRYNSQNQDTGWHKNGLTLHRKLTSFKISTILPPLPTLLYINILDNYNIIYNMVSLQTYNLLY